MGFHSEVPLIALLRLVLWCISGSRVPEVFVVELGAEINVA
jgi:hypothetical protein